LNNKYRVAVLELKEIHELPDAWEHDNLLELLNHIEYDEAGEIAAEDLKEMAAMALSDLDTEEAAIQVLELRIGEQLNKGQRQNIAEEIKGELFNTSCVLYWAFPNLFSEPDIVQIKLKVTASNSNAVMNLKTPTSSFIARPLNDGMDTHNTIFRLFKDSLSSNSFPEAQDIIWKFDQAGFDESDQSNTITVFTSWNWVDELKGVKNFESTAYSDK